MKALVTSQFAAALAVLMTLAGTANSALDRAALDAGLKGGNASGGSPALVVDIVTEENPPYNFTKNGKLSGFSTEVVEAVLKEINVQGKFHLMPWARAYYTALNSDDVLIYSIGRLPQREALFKWVGVVAPTEDSYLYSWRGRKLKLSSLEEAKKYQIGTLNADSREQFLVSKGFILGQNLQTSAKNEFIYEKLKRGRIDLWVVDKSVAESVVRRAGDDPAAVLEQAWRLAELGHEGVYMAFGARSGDALVERFRRGLDVIKANGTFDALKRKWF